MRLRVEFSNNCTGCMTPCCAPIKTGFDSRFDAHPPASADVRPSARVTLTQTNLDFGRVHRGGKSSQVKSSQVKSSQVQVQVKSTGADHRASDRAVGTVQYMYPDYMI